MCRLWRDWFAACTAGPMAGDDTGRTVRHAVMRSEYSLDRAEPGRPSELVASLGAGHTTGGRPSKVILTTVRHRIGCRVGRADHASR